MGSLRGQPLYIPPFLIRGGVVWGPYGDKGRVGPFRALIRKGPMPFISPPKAPGFRAEWAPLGPFLLGGSMGRGPLSPESGA